MHRYLFILSYVLGVFPFTLYELPGGSLIFVHYITCRAYLPSSMEL